MLSHEAVRSWRQSQPVLWLIVGVLAVAGALVGVPALRSILESVYRRTSLFSVLVIIIFFAVFPVWFVKLIKGQYRGAFALQMLMMNVTGRAADYASVVAYDAGDYRQLISVTTLLVFCTYLFCGRRQPLPRASAFLWARGCLWAFAVLTTISQFVNHTLWSAFWLSVGGVWQYVALFYIIARIVRTQDDVKYMLRTCVLTILVAISFRMGIYGQGFFVEGVAGGDYNASAEVARVNSPVFGSIYYAGYVAMMVPLALHFLGYAKGVLIRALWTLAVVVLLLEVVATVTRGAYLCLVFLVLLLWWPGQRVFFCKFVGFAAAAVLFLPRRVIEVATTREIYLDSRLFDIASVAARVQLWRASVPHFFDNFGLGYGIGKPLLFPVEGFSGFYEAHHVILETSQMAGGLAAIAFACMFCLVLINVWRASSGENGEAAKTVPFLVVSLAAWFWFANTTAVSILYYTPYESTMLMYVVLFTALGQIRVARETAAGGAGIPPCGGRGRGDRVGRGTV